MNSNNRYVLSDGTTLTSCDEYEKALKNKTFNDGFYENSADSSKPFYCHKFSFNGESKVYEIIELR